MVNFGIFNYDGVTGLRDPTPCGSPCGIPIARGITATGPLSTDPYGSQPLTWQTVLNLFLGSSTSNLDALNQPNGTQVKVPWGNLCSYDYSTGLWTPGSGGNLGISTVTGLTTYNNQNGGGNPLVGTFTYQRVEILFPQLFGNWCSTYERYSNVPGTPTSGPYSCSGPGPLGCSGNAQGYTKLITMGLGPTYAPNGNNGLIYIAYQSPLYYQSNTFSNGINFGSSNGNNCTGNYFGVSTGAPACGQGL